MPACPPDPHLPRPHRRRAAPGGVAVALAVALLLGCAQPRTPAPVVSAEPRVISPGGAATPARTPTTPAPTPVPVPMPPPIVPPTSAAPPPAPSPSPPPPSAAPIPRPPPAPPGVAALFPEPPVSFATPAFAPGRDGFTRSDEVRALLGQLAGGARRDTVAGDVRLLDVGVSRGGEPIVAIGFTREVAPPVVPAPALAPAASASSPAAAAATTPPPPRRPMVLLLAGQHGDEPAGTEALLALAQRLAAGERERVLERADVVVLPLANPDARALFQRETSEGVDLNRDHLALRTPEAQALAAFVAGLEPDVVVDFHEYPVHGPFESRFEALPRADVLLQAATVGNLHPFVARAAEEWFRLPLVQGLQAAGYSHDWYHTVPERGERRVRMGSVQADVARNVFGLRHAVSLLVETRGSDLGLSDLKRRVQAATLAAESVLASTVRRAGDLVKLHEFVERDVVAQACRAEAVLEAAPTTSEYTLAALDPRTGAPKRLAVTWDSALELRVLKSRPRPCGYWLSAAAVEAVSRLRRLGVEVQQLQEAGDVRGETFRELAREPRGDAAGDDGAVRVRVHAQPVLVDVPAGSYYVPLDQPLANLAIAALEPESPVGWLAAGIVAQVGDVARVLAPPAARMAPAPAPAL